jgi:hypothetical protein
MAMGLQGKTALITVAAASSGIERQPLPRRQRQRANDSLPARDIT